MKRASPQTPQMSHDDIQKAMKQFLDKGGKIKVLPQQRAIQQNVIGGDRWGVYEALDEFNF